MGMDGLPEHPGSCFIVPQALTTQQVYPVRLVCLLAPYLLPAEACKHCGSQDQKCRPRFRVPDAHAACPPPPEEAQQVLV